MSGAGGASEGYLNDQARLVAMRQAVIMYRDDPMYRAIIDGFVYFVIGKGLKFNRISSTASSSRVRRRRLPR